jgi:hypothetical protein
LITYSVLSWYISPALLVLRSSGFDYSFSFTQKLS